MITNKQFREKYYLQIGLMSIDTAVFSFMWFYFIHTLGHSFTKMWTVGSCSLLFAALLMAILRTHRMRRSLIIAFASRIVTYAVIVFTKDPYLSFFFAALIFVFFWSPFNVEFFSYTNKNNRAFSGGLQTAVMPFKQMVVPVLAGFMFHHYGYSSILLVSSIVCLFLIGYIYRITHFNYPVIKYSIFQVVSKMKNVRSLLFVEGMWEATLFMGMPILSLRFFDSEVSLGFFFSYLGLFALIATLVFSWVSDRFKKRTVFVYPLTIICGVCVMMLSVAHDAYTWTIVAGLFNFFTILAMPFLIAMPMDAGISHEELWIGREFMLNVGRGIGGLLYVVAFLLSGGYTLGFILIGSVFLLYPIILYRKGIY